VSLVVSFVIGLAGPLGLSPQVINEYWGIPGVILGVASLIMFSFVEPTVQKAKDDEDDHYKQLPDVAHGDDIDSTKGSACVRIKGLLMAVTAGLIYGVQFVPLKLWLQANAQGNLTNVSWVPDQCQLAMIDPELLSNLTGCAVLPSKLDVNTSSTNMALRFIFSQYVGIFGMSLIALIFYLIATCNKPKELPTKVFGPSILSGMVWALGAMGSIFATDGLGLSVGYPLTMNGAFLVNVSLTFFVYREIQGTRNVIMFLIAGVLNILSVICLSFSQS